MANGSSGDGRDGDPPGNPSLAAMMVAGGIVAAATATLGPAGAVGAAVLSPLAADLLEKAAAEWRREGERRAGVALGEASLTAHSSIEELLYTIGSDPSRLNLLAQTIDAAARSNLDAKVRMLGTALGSGALAQDGARVDEATLRVGVLAELEAPHLKVLDAIDHASRHVQGEWSGASEAALVDIVGDGTGPTSRGVLQPILRTLDRNGLICQTAMGDTWDEHLADDIRLNAGTNEWATTIFGRELLAEYREKGGSDPR